MMQKFFFSWSGVIERNIQWSLNLRCSSESWDAEITSSNRKFRKVQIDGMEESNRMMQFFKNHGRHVCDITFIDCTIENPAFWCQLLGTMTKLEKIVIKWCFRLPLLPFNDVSSNLLPTLQKLKTLEMEESSLEFLNLFGKCQLHTLKIRASSDYNQPRDPLTNLMATQKDLKVLALRSIDYTRLNLFESLIPHKSIQFKLKELSLRDFKIREEPNDDFGSLMMFMKWHAKSLEGLYLGRGFPHYFFEFVFGHFKKLTTLSLMQSSVYCDPGFGERLEELNGVIDLQITVDRETYNLTFDGMKMLVQHLPNVQKLSIRGATNNSIIKQIAENMKKLNNLAVTQFNGKSFYGVKFQALQSLRILNVTDLVEGNTLTKANAGIVDLSILRVYRHELDVKTITQNLKLCKLVIGDGKISCDGKFFEVIRKVHPELGILDCHADAKQVDIVNLADIHGLRFHANDYFIKQSGFTSVDTDDEDDEFEYQNFY